MILLCCASELGLPEDLSAIEVILYYYYYYPDIFNTSIYVVRNADPVFDSRVILVVKFGTHWPNF